MAYGLKYELLCNSKKSNLHTLKIYEDEYTDPDIDRNVALNAFRLVKDRQEFISGTSLEFFIREEVDFEFVELFTSVPKKYYVELFTGATKKWVGYLNTQQYQADYKPAPNTLQFTAIDGLGLLKSQYFSLTGRQDEFAIIRHCLTYLEYGIGYSIAIPIHETTHNTSLSPLEQTYHNCSIFSGMTCYEVIEEILERYNASITQVGARWQIVSSLGKSSNRLLYASDGTYESSEAAPSVLSLDYPDGGGDVYPVGGTLVHTLEPGGRKVNITHDYGLRESMLPNYDFALFDLVSFAFDDWTKNGSVSCSQRGRDNEYYAWLSGYANVDTDYIETSIGIVNVEDQSFIFGIDVCPVGYIISGGSISPIEMQIRVMVSLLVGATTHYLTSSGWSTTPGYITQTITSAVFASEIAWTNIKILTDEIPGDGTLTVRLMRYKNSAPGASVYYTGVGFHKPSAYFLDEGSFYDSQIGLVAEFSDSSEIENLNDMTLISADAPAVANANKLYDNISFLENGAPLYENAITTVWGIDGVAGTHSIVQLLARILASNNRSPRQKLSGTIRGSALTFDSIIQHTYNSSRKFEIASGEYDMYNEIWNVELIEVFDYAAQTIDISTVEAYVSNSGGTYEAGVTAHTHDDRYQPLDADLTAIAALTGDGILKKTSGTWGMDSTLYQAADPNFSSLADLTYASDAFVKMTGAHTFTLDTNAYSLTSHAHAESAITFTDITTNNATTSKHGYLPKLSGSTSEFLRGDGTWVAALELDADLTAIAALSGDGFLKKTSGTWGMDSSLYQAADANLSSLADLTYASGAFVKMTDAHTFTLDTSTYLTGITKSQVEAVLTGAITSHTHSYEPALGNPAADGRVLSSTAAGVRSWIPIATTDHGALTGLADDDHTQYYNETRGDARYSLTNHSHLNYATLNVTTNSKTSAYTVVTGDNNKIIECSGTFTVTLPDDLATGFQVTIVNVGTGTITIAASTTLYSKDSNRKLASRWIGATAYHQGSDIWILMGDLTA